MQIFDSHTHLNSEEFYDDVQTFVDHASELGVKKRLRTLAQILN